jgi:hypothetical protein
LAVTTLYDSSDAEALRAKQKVCPDYFFYERTSVRYMAQKSEDEKTAAAGTGATSGTTAGTAAAGKGKK